MFRLSARMAMLMSVEVRREGIQSCCTLVLTGAGCEEAFVTLAVKIRAVGNLGRISGMGPAAPLL